MRNDERRKFLRFGSEGYDIDIWSLVWNEQGSRYRQYTGTENEISPSNEYTTAILPRNLLRVIVTVVIVVDILLQVVVGVGLLKVLAEGSISRVSSTSRCYTIKKS